PARESRDAGAVAIRIERAHVHLVSRARTARQTARASAVWEYTVRMDADGVDLSRALSRLYGPAGATAFQITKLKGDASTRSYYRIAATADVLPQGAPRSLIAMRLPENPLGSDERGGGERITELPFVDVQRMLAKRGLPVPRIYVDDTAGRVLLLE